MFSAMKNNFKFLKLRKIDIRLQSLNNFFEDAIRNKLEELTDLKEDLMEVVEKNYLTSYNKDDEVYSYDVHQEKNKFLVREKLKYEKRQDEGCDIFLNAGYVDCMEEAIRFLVEKENISPEHPMVKNLKIHLQKSKEELLGGFFPMKYDLPWDDIDQ